MSSPFVVVHTVIDARPSPVTASDLLHGPPIVYRDAEYSTRSATRPKKRD